MTNEEFIKSITLEGEIWKDVIGWEGLYMVSTMGRVVSLNREIYYKNRNKPRIMKPFLKSPIIRNDKYCFTYLEHGGKKERYYIHRLVAINFIPNPNNYPEVDHIDTNPSNNKITNLRWCTPSMNSYNPLTSAKNSASHKGLPNARSKAVVQLKDGEIHKIYNYILLAETEGHKSYGICHCLKDRNRTYHGYKWMYLSDYETLINKSKNDLLSQ